MHGFHISQVSFRIESLGLWEPFWVLMHAFHTGNNSSVLFDQVAINYHYHVVSTSLSSAPFIRPTIFVRTMGDTKWCCRSESHAFFVGGYAIWHLGSFTEVRESTMLLHKLVNFIGGMFLNLRIVAHQGKIPVERD